MNDIIIRIAARGDGITADGRHAAFAAPGDVMQSDGSVTPGPHHRIPPCSLFPACGGCRLQHLDEESYATFVTDRIASALDAHGINAPMRPPVISPPRTRRRAILHAEAKGGRIRIGFTQARNHALVDMTECHLLTPKLFALIDPLRHLLRKLRLERRGNVHLTEVDQGVELIVTGLAAEGLEAAELISAFCRMHGVARFAIDQGFGPEVRWEPEPVTVTLGNMPVQFPPGAFLQATAEGEAALINAVRDGLGRADTVADLFAGLGTFALALSQRVYAAEGARDAADALKSVAKLRKQALFVEHRDLYRRPLSTPEINRFDAIILDPPRAGARDQIENIAPSQVRTLIYISCNPSSFARDTAKLYEGGWRIAWVQGVGQFLWSTHIELVARFIRPDIAP